MKGLELENNSMERGQKSLQTQEIINLFSPGMSNLFLEGAALAIRRTRWGRQCFRPDQILVEG